MEEKYKNILFTLFVVFFIAGLITCNELFLIASTCFSLAFLTTEERE